jgi:hypothetical protein
VKQREGVLFREADVVLYANEQLFQAERGEVSGEAVLIGHGVDTGLFTPLGPVALVLASIPEPRVGFFGELRERSVNFELIASVGQLCPAINFILGGPQLDYLGQLRQLPNVRVLAPCPHQEMPARWRGLNAAILPYRSNAWLEASEPIKLNEILAMGLSAVATPLPAVTRHSEFIKIADNPTSFADSLWQVLAVSGDNDTKFRQARRAGLCLSSWGSIADRIDQLSQSIA